MAIETKRESGETTTQYASKAPGLMVPSTSPAMRQQTSHTSAYVSACVSICQAPGLMVPSTSPAMRQHTSGYVSIRQRT